MDMKPRSAFAALAAIERTALVAAAICAASPSFAAEYVADADPRIESLENGKITFAYDDGGAITNLTMTPDPGETLTLSGDELNFAANARIKPGQNGTSCISNAITCAGTLWLGMTNMVYNGALLSKTEYKTMFHNVHLDDISPISSDAKGVSSTGGVMYYPYHVVREGDTLRAEFQAVNGTYIKCYQLELKQDGDDIVGKLLNNGYLNNTTNYLGVSLFEDPMFSSTSYDYGMKQLTIGPRREEYIHSRELISENGTVVAENVQVEDLEIAYAFSGIPKKYNGCPRMTSYPSHVKLENGVLSAQFQMVDGASIKCVKLAFSQVGANVVANYVYAKYATGYDEGHDYDFDKEGQTYNLLTKERYADNSNAYGYGIDMVVLRNKAKNRLLLPVPDHRDVNIPLAGGGCEVIFDSGTSEAAPVESNVTRVNPALYGTKYTTLTTEHALKDIVVTGGRIGGSWCNKATGRDSVVVDWKNNGKFASCQIHARDGTSVKGVDVELRQNGNAVEIRCKQAIYHATKADEYFGIKRVVPDVDGATTQTLSTSATSKAYALLWMEWDLLPRPRATVFATAANSMTDSTFTIKGDETRPLEFLVMNVNALPSGSTECWGDSGLHIYVAAAFGNGISNGHSDLIMHPGSRLYQSGTQSFLHSRQVISLDAATLYGQYLASNQCYANFLTLANGSCVRGDGPLQLGYDTATKWTIAGEGAVTNEMNIMLLSYNGGASARYPGIDVADTVPGEAADFIQNGDIYNSPTYYNTAITKTGPGTMLMNGTFSTTNAATRIVDGTILLNKTDATVAGVGFDLQGGTLACAAGTTNAMGAVSVTASATLPVGAGASLTMANVSVADGQTLAIESADGTGAKAVKVNAALDAATLSRIRLNGRRPTQTSDGYLVIGGFMLIVR